jgi:CRP-like cAMP-binding protein
LVADLAFLDALSPTARDALVAAGRSRRYPKGSLVYAAGDEGHDVLIIRSGAVKVVVGAPNGREVILDVLHAGDLVGELSAVDGGPRSATVFALESTEALVIAHRTFRAMLANHASIGDALLTMLSHRLRGSGLRQLEFGSNDALGRLCQRIIEMGHRYGTRDESDRLVVEGRTIALSCGEGAAFAAHARLDRIGREADRCRRPRGVTRSRQPVTPRRG